jgi:hypothetical protein
VAGRDDRAAVHDVGRPAGGRVGLVDETSQDRRVDALAVGVGREHHLRAVRDPPIDHAIRAREAQALAPQCEHGEDQVRRRGADVDPDRPQLDDLPDDGPFIVVGIVRVVRVWAARRGP